jgi:hypothetical protein
MLALGRRCPDRIWAVEGCNGIGKQQEKVYGHMIDANLWQAARLCRGHLEDV